MFILPPTHGRQTITVLSLRGQSTFIILAICFLSSWTLLRFQRYVSFFNQTQISNTINNV
jgi:hypothetical protein